MNKSRKLIITHDGTFHADDVFALAALKILFKGQVRVIRTRNERIIRGGAMVVDVGRIHNVKKNRFDHHQGAGKRTNGVPYASFGLVWKRYGQRITGSQRVAAEIDRRLVQPIDAIDNGFDFFELTNNFFPYTVSDIVSSFNPRWNETASVNRQFSKAVRFAEKIILREIAKSASIIKAEKFVLQTYKKTKDKRIIILNKKYPWEEVLINFIEPKFVVFPYENNLWSVKAVRKNPLSFKNRLSFPQAWAGKEGRQLAAVSGVSDAVFCHNGLFMVTAGSRKGAIELAKKALKGRG